MNLRKDKRNLHVALILDESGSMDSVRDEMITGINEHIQELKKKAANVNTTITLVKFSGHENVKGLYVNKPISEIQNFTRDDYQPDGLTAMYDGVAKGFNLIDQNSVDADDTRYLALIVSDGRENDSKEFNASVVSKMVKDREDTKKWTITYLGSNQNLREVQQNLGIKASNIASYTSSKLGTRSAMKSMSDNTVAYACALASNDVNLDTAFYNKTADAIASISENEDDDK